MPPCEKRPAETKISAAEDDRIRAAMLFARIKPSVPESAGADVPEQAVIAKRLADGTSVASSPEIFMNLPQSV